MDGERLGLARGAVGESLGGFHGFVRIAEGEVEHGHAVFRDILETVGELFGFVGAAVGEVVADAEFADGGIELLGAAVGVAAGVFAGLADFVRFFVFGAGFGFGGGGGFGAFAFGGGLTFFETCQPAAAVEGVGFGVGGEGEQLVWFPLVFEVAAFGEEDGVFEGEGFVPEFPAEDGFEETIASVLPCAAAFVEGL